MYDGLTRLRKNTPNQITAIAAGGIAKGHAVLRMRLKLMPPEGLTRTLQNLS